MGVSRPLQLNHISEGTKVRLLLVHKRALTGNKGTPHLITYKITTGNHIWRAFTMKTVLKDRIIRY